MGKRRLYRAARAAQGASPDVPPTWRERLAALRYVPPLLRLVFQTHRGYTVSILLLRVVRSFVPVAVLWIGKLIIDAVIAGAATIRRGGVPDWRHLATLVGIELAIAVVGEGLARLSSLVESLLGDLFANEQSVRLMRHAATLDLAQFENAEVYDHLERARRQTVGRIGLLTLLLGTAQDLITLISLASVLLLQLPWLLLLLAVAVLPAFLGEAHFASLGYSLLFKWTPERRLLDYLRYLGASAVIIYRTVLGAFPIGTLPFLAGSFRSSRSLIQSVLLQLSSIYEQSLYLSDLFTFFDVQPKVVTKPGARPVPRPIVSGFRFENVGFRYPGSQRWAVRHLTFDFTAQERIALVGENGAGKTTLVKLLARLYAPEEGQVLLEGVVEPGQ